MGNLTLPKGSMIYQIDTPLTHVACIIKGSVTASSNYEEFTLHAGDVIGITDISRKIHSFSYQAKEDCLIVSYALKGDNQIERLLTENATLAKCALSSSIKQTYSLLDSYLFQQYDCMGLYNFLCSSYEEYKNLCKVLLIPAKAIPLPVEQETDSEEIPVFEENKEIDQWIRRYYEDLQEMQKDHTTEHFISHPAFTAGLILKAANDASVILRELSHIEEYRSELSSLLLNENHLDFYDLYTTLYNHCLKAQGENPSLASTISMLEEQIQSSSCIDKALAEKRIRMHKEKEAKLLEEKQRGLNREDENTEYHLQLQNSLDTILKYADCSHETALTFKQLVGDYKKVIDKNATDSDLKKLRGDLTGLFYEIYVSAFRKSLTDSDIPVVLKMFFQFGYVDEQLAGEENAAYLCSIADSFCGDPERNVYTAYEWFTAVYQGLKQPRRNEYDVDYQGYVHEQLLNKKIDKQKEKELLEDNEKKLLFELSNFFPSVNKMTFGRITSFCPVFSEHNVLTDLKDSLITPQRLKEILDMIRSVDYSAFYREELFFDNASNVREQIQTEILPDIILMPNIGTRGVMWQEIEGKRRSSPATYALPAFLLENPEQILIRLTGEFRYEMCKRTQGARWNDVSEPSLTSEYCDYAQFYRKNNDLSPDTKDKIRAALAKARGSYKQMFVQDYLIWILYEGKGSPRLNKVARRILFTYCPFTKDIRKSLSANPLYKDVIDRWGIKRSQQKNRFENLLKKLQNSGKMIPEELLKQQEFLEL
ncbi:MAG: hypothetical protein IJ711_10190 [Lachnospiraceae bacterium]|nr:hypothetical protein [Lachnospiraceae bacterium]